MKHSSIYTINRKKILLFLHIISFYLLSTLTIYYYLGESLARWIFQSLLFTLGLIISYNNFGNKERLLIENILGFLFITTFIVQTVLIWAGYYVLKDIFAIAFSWGLVYTAYYLISKRTFLNFYLISFILMIYSASISYNLYYLVIFLVYSFLSLSYFIILVPPISKELNEKIQFGISTFKTFKSSFKMTLVGFIIAIFLYALFPFFWQVNFINLPITKNQNYFGQPNTEMKQINIPGFSLDFNLTSGKVWDNPIEVIQLKTSHPSYVHYLKAVVYDNFDGKKWSSSFYELNSLKNISWQFKIPFNRLPFIKYETDTQIITYLHKIPNILFYENYPEVVRFPARSIKIDKNGNIYIPSILKFPFKYSIVSKLPIKINPPQDSVPAYRYSDDFSPYLSYSKCSKRTRDLVYIVTYGAKDDYEKAKKLTDYLKRSYTYDIDFSFLPKEDDLVDYFLFRYKKGYCEQFATVLAMMLRIADVPSRAVTGFAGGRYDPRRNAIIFSGNNAHAWVEAYINGYGWITFDPTPVSDTSIIIPKSHFFSFLGKIFGLDPQSLVPVKVKKMIKTGITNIFIFIKHNFAVLLLMIAIIIMLIFLGRIIQSSIKDIRLKEKISFSAYLFKKFEVIIKKHFKIKRKSYETETEYIDGILKDNENLSDILGDFLELYLRCRYSCEQSDSKTNLLNQKIMLIKKQVKKQ